MNVEKLLNVYRRVAERGNRLPAMNSVDFEMSSERLPSAAEAWESIVAFAPVAGWLGCQSQNRAFTASNSRSKSHNLLIMKKY